MNPDSGPKFKVRRGPKYQGAVKARVKKAKADAKLSNTYSGEELSAISGDDRLEFDDEFKPIVVEGERPKVKPKVRSTKDQLEYRRKQVLRLVLRGVPKTVIAEHLGVNTATVYKDIRAVQFEIEKEVQNMNFPQFVGLSLAFFDEARNIALRLATDTNNKKVMEKISALNTAIKAESDKHQFLERCGLYRLINPSLTFPRASGPVGQEFDDEGDLKRFLQVVSGGGQSLSDFVGSVDGEWSQVDES